MVATSGGSVDVIFCGESTIGLVVVASGSWDSEGITYGKSNRIFINGDSRRFIIDVSDIDSDIGVGVKGRSAVVCNFDTESNKLVFFKI